MHPLMREDRYHIEIEDVSQFPIERSYDCQDWEEVPHDVMDKILSELSDDKVRVFIGVLTSGSTPRLGEHFYRIRPQDTNFT